MKKITITLLFLFFSHTGVYADFSGGYDVANWTQDLNGGTIDLSGAPSSVVAISSNSGGGSSNTDFTITALASGNVTFDWSYDTADDDGSSFDPFGWLLNGVFTQITVNGLSTTQTGSVTFAVVAGDTFGFRAHSTDSGFGAATTTITNFSAPQLLPTDVPSLSFWGIMLLSMLLGLTAIKRSRKMEVSSR